MQRVARGLGACLLASLLVGCSGSSESSDGSAQDLSLPDRASLASSSPGATFATVGSTLPGASAWNVSLSRDASAVVMTAVGGSDNSEGTPAQFALLIDEDARPVATSYRIAAGVDPSAALAALRDDLAADAAVGSPGAQGKRPLRLALAPDDVVSVGRTLVSSGTKVVARGNVLYNGANLVWTHLCGQSLADSLPGIGLGSAASAEGEIGLVVPPVDGQTNSSLAAKLSCPNDPDLTPATPAASTPAAPSSGGGGGSGGSSGSASGGSTGRGTP